MTQPLPLACPSPADRAPARQPVLRVLPSAERPAAPRPDVHIGYSRAVFAYLRLQGVNPASLYAADLVHRVEQAAPGETFPLDDFHAVIDVAQRHLRDPDLAIKASEHVQPWDGGVLGFALMTSPSISEVGNLLVRYQRLFTNVYEVRPHVDDHHFQLRLVSAAGTHSTALAHLLMGTWAWRSRWFTGEPSLPFDACFEGPAPADVSAYERCFGGQVRFGQSANLMQGQASYLALPVRQHDPAANAALRAQVALELERLSGDAAGLLVVLRRRVRERLGSGSLTLDALAADLDMAPRTLQARLEERGLTFRALLDGVRERKAKQYLAEAHLNLTEIALALGFANQSAFQHAFKRWTDMSPGQWRREQTGR
ncbi:AraC family transcriptional regulator [Piscinibacter gummiphilus]|uniref:AraC family transcriptional regulator n=1 Tax=Piscinibacter gummiphilus TaxID=946333 RepID=UPI000A2720C5|nr:AraC family transcriptional regulator [Piscinibacter gummiphilus]ATU67394.1 AraC family transcriptional regulator [Piscinibacter gummiphilus]